jgi:hypothetical protein
LPPPAPPAFKKHAAGPCGYHEVMFCVISISDLSGLLAAE